jgi:alanine-glyoxylate transaminase/serine-glyoxylate transaminase/serine-pyruvate transaminase
MDQLFARRAEVADRIRALVRSSSMDVFAQRPGNGITAVIPPAKFDIDELVRRLEVEYDIQIAGGLGRLRGQIFRIGHVGDVTDEELEYFEQSFKRCLA